MSQQDLQLKLNSKVQFFQSQSSFGTQSMVSNSRLNDLIEEILQNTDSIFINLKKYLSNNPVEKTIDQDYLITLYNRARILSKQTIPEQLQFITQIKSDNQQSSILNQCQERLNKFVSHFQNYQTGRLTYKQLYNNYSISNVNQYQQSHVGSQSPFSKKSSKFNDEDQIYIRPQIVQIVSKKGPQLSGGTTNHYNLQQYKQQAKDQVLKKQKEILKLNEQIARLKKLQRQQNILMQISSLNQKRQAEERIQKVIRLRKQQSRQQTNKQLTIARNLVASCQQDIKLQYNKNIQCLQKMNNLYQAVWQLQRRNKILERNDRKILNGSQVSEISDTKSVNSYLDMGGGDPNKMKKIIRNLTAQKNILKKQINQERQINSKIKPDKEQEYLNQINLLHKNIKHSQNQQSQLAQQFDHLRVQNIKLKQLTNSNQKFLANLKSQNANLKRNQGIISKLGINRNLEDDSLKTQYTNQKKVHILSYQGDGIQGYPYYQLLNKEFRIRYKRSCLKDKELLFKANGLQIGIISQFVPPNQINIRLHLTNYSDNLQKDLKLKVINPSQNKFTLDHQDIKIIKIGQQIKVCSNFTINNYPMGPSILICQHVNQEKLQQLRILLPVHIFKMMFYKSRTQQQTMRRPQAIKIRSTERKILKDFATLKSYFQNSKQKIKIFENTLKISAFHEHTNTLTFMDIKIQTQQLEILYENTKGDQKISQYYIKTLVFLLSK